MVSVCRQCCWELCRQHRNSFHLSTVCPVAHWRFLNFALTLERNKFKLTKFGCYCSPVINSLFIKAVKYFPKETVQISEENSAKYNCYNKFVLRQIVLLCILETQQRRHILKSRTLYIYLSYYSTIGRKVSKIYITSI